MNTGWNVAVLLILYAICFQMFCQNEKDFVLTKCKQKICNTKEETKKNSLCYFYKTIKCNNNE